MNCGNSCNYSGTARDWSWPKWRLVQMEYRDTYSNALDVVDFWRKCAEHPVKYDDCLDVLRFLAYEREATCACIGFASMREG